MEQPVRPLREFEQFDPFLDVVLVGGLVRLDVAQQPALLGPELAGFAVEEVVVDPAVELVHVHGVDAVLDPLVLAAQLRDRLVMELLLK